MDILKVYNDIFNKKEKKDETCLYIVLLMDEEISTFVLRITGEKPKGHLKKRWRNSPPRRKCH